MAEWLPSSTVSILVGSAIALVTPTVGEESERAVKGGEAAVVLGLVVSVGVA